MIRLKDLHGKPAEQRFITALSDCAEKYMDIIKNIVYPIISKLDGISGGFDDKPLYKQIWFRDFILADFSSIKGWVESEPLVGTKVSIFRDIYENDFSNGNKRFLDKNKTYNAYTFLNDLNIGVCPYCENENLKAVARKPNQRSFRTAQIDHYYPKSDYPLMAMCFYNLVPCGSDCNFIKLKANLGMSPYEKDIESKTFLYPDIPIGINMESIDPYQCAVGFHARGGMETNVNVLNLESRYEDTALKVHKILKNKQQFSADTLNMILSTDDESIKRQIVASLFEIPAEGEKYHELHVKLRTDLLSFAEVFFDAGG